MIDGELKLGNGYDIAVAEEAAHAVYIGRATHAGVIAAFERALLRRSIGLPRQRVLYNDRRGAFGFSAEFQRFRQSEKKNESAFFPTIEDRTEPVEDVERFGEEMAKKWPVAARVLTFLASDEGDEILWNARQFRTRVDAGSIRETKRARRALAKGAAAAASALGADEPRKLVEKLFSIGPEAPFEAGRGRKGASDTLDKLLELRGETDVDAWVDFARDKTRAEMAFILEHHAKFTKLVVDPMAVGLGFASGERCALRIASVPALMAIEIDDVDGDEDVRWNKF